MLQENTSAHTGSQVIQATQVDYDQIAKFLNQNNTIHRHLDWFGTLDWLGTQPFFVELLNDHIQALLCAAPENKESAWIRTFGVRKLSEASDSWQRLLSKAIQKLQDMNITCLGALAHHSWFKNLLENAGFNNRQNIVVLEWQGKFPPQERIATDFKIRHMRQEDLAHVAEIDKLAFPSLWQNSLTGLTQAFFQTGISTVAIDEMSNIIGYQISTYMTIYGHLARLAVHPEYQRRGIAFALVDDLLKQFENRGFWRITVNTQSDNIPSLKLYDIFGFKPTKEEIPVYEIEL